MPPPDGDLRIVPALLLSTALVGAAGCKTAPTAPASQAQLQVAARHGKNAEGARAFARLVESRDGQALLERYGFGGSAEQLGK